MPSLSNNELISETQLFTTPELPTDNSVVMEAAMIIDGARDHNTRLVQGANAYLVAEAMVRGAFRDTLLGIADFTDEPDQALDLEVAAFLITQSPDQFA